MIAYKRENADGAIFHSDRGSNYTSAQFAEAVKNNNIRQSVGGPVSVAKITVTRLSGNAWHLTAVLASLGGCHYGSAAHNVYSIGVGYVLRE